MLVPACIISLLGTPRTARLQLAHPERGSYEDLRLSGLGLGLRLARLRQLDCGGGGQPRPPGRGDAPRSARQQPLPSHHLLHWDNLEPVEIRRR